LQETTPDDKFVSMEPTARVRLAKDVLMQKVGDDAILLNLNTENYFALDEVGTRIINTLQESDSVKQAIGKLVGIYEVDESKLTGDAMRLFALLDQAHSVASQFAFIHFVNSRSEEHTSELQSPQ